MILYLVRKTKETWLPMSINDNSRNDYDNRSFDVLTWKNTHMNWSKVVTAKSHKVKDRF